MLLIKKACLYVCVKNGKLCQNATLNCNCFFLNSRNLYFINAASFYSHVRLTGRPVYVTRTTRAIYLAQMGNGKMSSYLCFLLINI